MQRPFGFGVHWPTKPIPSLIGPPRRSGWRADGSQSESGHPGVATPVSAADQARTATHGPLAPRARRLSPVGVNLSRAQFRSNLSRAQF